MIVPHLKTLEELDREIVKIKYELDYGGFLHPIDKVRSAKWSVYQSLLREKEQLQKK